MLHPSPRRLAAIIRLILAAGLAVATSAGTAWAHVRPQSSAPQPGARLDAVPAHLVVNYDGPVNPDGTSLVLLDSSGAPVPTTVDPVTSNRMSSIAPSSDLAPGPYTVDWTTVDAQDGHVAQGFYTFTVNGGPVGIIVGAATSQAPAADLMASLTVTTADDGASVLRIALSDTTAVERVRVRLSRPDLGEDLLDTQASGEGDWLLVGNQVAVPGIWHAEVVVRRTNVFDDAQAAFDFTIDPVTGLAAFSQT